MQGAANGHENHAGDIIPAPANGCPQSIAADAHPADIVAGQTFLTGANTVIFGNPQVGDWVSFEGHLLADGSRFADRIVLLSHSPENQFGFIGKVESIGGTAWTISGRVVQVNDSTVIEPGLKVGDSVQVAGRITGDGNFLATRLSRTERHWGQISGLPEF